MTYVQPGNGVGPYATPHPWQPNDDSSCPQVLLRVADLNRELAVGPRPQPPVVQPPVVQPPIQQATSHQPANQQAANQQAANQLPSASVPYVPPRPVERSVTPPSTLAPTADPTAPQTTISAAVLPSVSETDTPVTAEVQPASPTLAVLAAKLTHTTDTPTDPVASVVTAATATSAPAVTVTASAQHRPLPFLSSFLLSSRRRQLMTFSLAVMALLVLFRAPSNRSADPKSTTDSTTQRENPPRRVAEGSDDVGQSDWDSGIPAAPQTENRGSGTSTSPAGWTQSANEGPAPTTPLDNSQPAADQSAAHEAEAERAPQIDLTGMEYPATDPATFQYPANAHDLIISMLARNPADHVSAH